METIEIYHRASVEKGESKLKILQMILGICIIGIGMYEFSTQGKIRLRVIFLAIFIVFSLLKSGKGQTEAWVTTRIIDNYNSIKWEYPNLPTRQGRMNVGYEMDYHNIKRMVYYPSQNYFVLEAYPIETRLKTGGQPEVIDHLKENHLVTLSIRSAEVKKVVDFCERLMPARVEYL